MTTERINDFVLKIGTVNGTGSASANSLLMKALFRMGVPVTGKNLFPSNIQGLPTWYEVRANRDGYMARERRVDVMVAMNAQTYARDLAEVAPGGFLIYDSTWPRESDLVRDDITILGVPLARMCNEHFAKARVRILMKNIAYVGVLSALLGIDRGILKQLLEETFAAKPKLVDSNLEAINLGYEYATENFTCPLPIRAEAMGDNDGHILIDGNSAAALGCVYAGATVGAWYPITPSTSLMDAFHRYCNMFRRDDDGANRFCIVQAEDELAAAGMVLGASWVGARAFTPTSGPGISLMSEFIGFAYYAEIPSVFFDVQRVGPSTGMPTRTQQCDVLLCAYASHGDTRHPLLFPADPRECFEMAVAAFDLAERLQTPVFVLSDLDIGMNDWMIPELEWNDSYRPDRGKVLRSEDLDRIGDRFRRYLDIDGDGITYRTYPGEDARGAYFVRGSGHNRHGGYTEDAHEYQDVVDRLLVKWDTARNLVPEPALRPAARKTPLGIIAYGSSDGAVNEALDRLAERGVHLDYMRVKAFPFSRWVESFLASHETVFVVEQNRDGQLRTLLLAETETASRDQLVSVLHYNGMPIPSDCVIEAVSDYVAGEEAAA